MNCPNCSQELQKGWQSCPYCGVALPASGGGLLSKIGSLFKSKTTPSPSRTDPEPVSSKFATGKKSTTSQAAGTLDQFTTSMDGGNFGGTPGSASGIGNVFEKIKIVEEFARGGNKINAIKEYRAIYGVGLKEAKEAVDFYIERGHWRENAGPPPGDAGSLISSDMEKVYQAIRAGKKIEAIKWYREAHGTGLKESKEAVEDIIARKAY